VWSSVRESERNRVGALVASVEPRRLENGSVPEETAISDVPPGPGSTLL
jgi:hypothetical protein